MIFVDRNRIAVPDMFRSAKVRAAQQKAEMFFSRSRQARLQERFEFNAKIWKDAREHLSNLFQGKCAYCESPLISGSSGGTELFRPRIEAVGLIPRKSPQSRLSAQNTPKRPTSNWISDQKSESDPEAYWWLAYDWENLYLACDLCNRNKRNQFPVIGTRAPVGTRGASLLNELALLLNPCADHPENYLIFDESGTVSSRKPSDKNEITRFRGMDRGAITIDVLGLNRSDLVAARKREMDALRKNWALIASDESFSPATEKRLLSAIDLAQPHPGMRRQFVKQWSFALYDKLSATGRPRLLEALRDLVPELVGHGEKRARFSPPKRRRVSADKTKRPPKKKTPRPRKQQTIGFLKTVRIQNFKAIRDLTLQLPAGTDNGIGWKVLLGENGAGKSSIMQAVALTLMGPNYLRRYLHDFRLKPIDLLRKVRGDRTVATASVKIEFSTGRKISLQISPKRFEFLTPPPEGLFVRAYGATRLLPRRNVPRVRVRKRLPKKVANLFDPAKPVFNADGWLAGLKSRKDFGSAALSLKDLLNLPGMSKLHVKGGKVVIPVNGLTHSLDELSAGYESVLVMAADIMAGLIGTMRDFRHAPGIILLDEIDAHLHPRWKMRIVESLRRTFSSMQFLVTTHEPLCLRGIEKGEVVVLERVGKEISVLEDLPAPKSMRVDQLLTSNFFGLGSTIDPTVEKEFNRYYELMAKDQRTATQQQDSERLRRRLIKYEHRLMAGTPREELLYEAIDEYVAKEASLRGRSREKLPELREDTKARVKELWKSFGQSGGKLK